MAENYKSDPFIMWTEGITDVYSTESMVRSFNFGASLRHVAKFDSFVEWDALGRLDVSVVYENIPRFRVLSTLKITSLPDSITNADRRSLIDGVVQDAMKIVGYDIRSSIEELDGAYV